MNTGTSLAKASKYDKIVTLVSAVGPFYGETIVIKMEKLGRETTCDAIVKKNLQSVQVYWIWEEYCRKSR